MKKILILLFSCSLAATAAYSQDDTYYTDDEATVTVKSQEAPPPIPDYVQPAAPVEGDIWTPGYWAWGGGGYYWVPGVWVAPPSAGLLWTPGYWGFYHGYYGWHNGYWGPHIGYYGGVNYGFGYTGTGFYGGRWEGGHFLYNTAVWHVGGGFHNVYVDRSVIHNNVVNHASFNGPGGVHYRPTEGERSAIVENHTVASHEQMEHEHSMSTEHGQFHSGNAQPAVHSMGHTGGERFDAGGRSMGGGGFHGGGGHAGGGHGGGRH